MRVQTLIQFILPTTILASPDTSLGSTLNVTVLGARHNRSTLECWALQSGFETSDKPGQVGSAALDLGTVGGNASFAVLPAGFDGGRHNAPALQWVVFLSGLAHITLPNSTTEAWIEGGKNGAILALDTADVSALGHFTTYPSQDRTTSVVIPLGEKGVPGHRVLHEGPCRGRSCWYKSPVIYRNIGSLVMFILFLPSPYISMYQGKAIGYSRSVKNRHQDTKVEFNRH